MTVRAAAELGETPSNPYVVVQLGDQDIETDVATAGGENPVSWGAPPRAAACRLALAALRRLDPPSSLWFDRRRLRWGLG